jgi:hypothetical protein
MAEMKFPDKQEFLDLFNIFPKGNPETILLEVNYAITSYKTFSGDPVTWDLIKKSYKSYVEKRESDGVDAQFIKSLDSFLRAKDFNIDFNNEPSMKKKNVFEKGLDSSISDLERRLNGNKE